MEGGRNKEAVSREKQESYMEVYPSMGESCLPEKLRNQLGEKINR